MIKPKQMPRLGARLSAIVEMVPASSFAADIGCDHGYVSAALLLSGRVKEVCACDVAPGPLDRARKTFDELGVTEGVSFFLSDGLTDPALRAKILSLGDGGDAGESDGCLIIAGMGGMLMMRILSESSDLLDCFASVVLGPQSDVPKVRRWLAENGFRIDEERLVKEEGKYYRLLRAVHGEQETDAAGEAFGAMLLSMRDPVLYEWLIKQRTEKEKILATLASGSGESSAVEPPYTARINEVRDELSLIETALDLYNGESDEV